MLGIITISWSWIKHKKPSNYWQYKIIIMITIGNWLIPSSEWVCDELCMIIWMIETNLPWMDEWVYNW